LLVGTVVPPFGEPNICRAQRSVSSIKHSVAGLQVSEVKVELTTCPSSEEALLNRQRSLTECMAYISATLKVLNDVLNESEPSRDMWATLGAFCNKDRIQSTIEAVGAPLPTQIQKPQKKYLLASTHRERSVVS
jgi:hypothetical protein